MTPSHGPVPVDLLDLPVLDQVLQPAPDGLSREQIQARVHEALRAEVRAEILAETQAEIRAGLLRELEPRCRAEALAQARQETQDQARQHWQRWLTDELPQLVQQHIQAGQQQWIACITQGVLQQAPRWAESLHQRVLADLQQHLNQNLEPLTAQARTQWEQALQGALLLSEDRPAAQDGASPDAADRA